MIDRKQPVQDRHWSSVLIQSCKANLQASIEFQGVHSHHRNIPFSINSQPWWNDRSRGLVTLPFAHIRRWGCRGWDRKRLQAVVLKCIELLKWFVVFVCRTTSGMKWVQNRRGRAPSSMSSSFAWLRRRWTTLPRTCCTRWRWLPRLTSTWDPGKSRPRERPWRPPASGCRANKAPVNHNKAQYLRRRQGRNLSRWL